MIYFPLISIFFSRILDKCYGLRVELMVFTASKRPLLVRNLNLLNPKLEDRKLGPIQYMQTQTKESIELQAFLVFFLSASSPVSSLQSTTKPSRRVCLLSFDRHNTRIRRRDKKCDPLHLGARVICSR
jgi:hypothetical protein